MSKKPSPEHLAVESNLAKAIEEKARKREALIATLELPDCGCYPLSAYAADEKSLPPPCPHMLSKNNLVGKVDFENWKKVLAEDPEEYETPKDPPTWQIFATLDDELNVMAERVQKGYRPRHPEDKRTYHVESERAKETKTGPGIHHHDNGADRRDGSKTIHTETESRQKNGRKPHPP